MARPRRSRSRVKVDVSEIEDWERRLRMVGPELARRKGPLHRRWAIEAARTARSKAPEGATGNLRRSIRPIPANDPRRAGVVVSSRDFQFYGLFIERGTVERFTRGTGSSRGSVTPQPFMAPAIKGRNRTRWRQEAGQLALDVLRR